jgi:2-methylcitrate dehydratase PrpD
MNVIMAYIYPLWRARKELKKQKKTKKKTKQKKQKKKEKKRKESSLEDHGVMNNMHAKHHRWEVSHH